MLARARLRFGAGAADTDSASSSLIAGRLAAPVGLPRALAERVLIVPRSSRSEVMGVSASVTMDSVLELKAGEALEIEVAVADDEAILNDWRVALILQKRREKGSNDGGTRTKNKIFRGPTEE